VVKIVLEGENQLNQVRVDGDILPLWAVGGMRASFALSRGNKIIWSTPGDTVDTVAELEQITTALIRTAESCECVPRAIAVDQHPELLTSRWAKTRQEQIIAVQHHYAHALTALAPDYTRPALAVVFDGLGYGSDGTAWGGEFLRLCNGGWQRFASLQPLPLLGGDAATRAPYRLLAGYLTSWGLPLGDCENKIIPELRDNVAAILTSGINVIPCSSVGRLFDAVSALLGIADAESVGGTAAIALQQAAESTEEVVELPAAFAVSGEIERLLLEPLFASLQEKRNTGVPSACLARSFHRWLATSVIEALASEREKCDISDVVLAGGVWHNTLLRTMVTKGLATSGLNDITNLEIPFDDSGLAVGQIFAAALALDSE